MTEICHTTRDRLSAYVDGELPAPQAAAVAEHLTSCAACSEEYELTLDTIGQLRDELKRYKAPDVFRARVRAALASTPSAADTEPMEPSSSTRPPSRLSRMMRPAVSAAALLVAVALGATVTRLADRGGGRDASVGAEVLASHVRSLMPDHLTDVRSSDQHNVKPWFNGRLDYSPSVPRLEENGFPLVGGRVDYVSGRPVAVVVYARRQHMINVFSWPTSERDQDPTLSAAHGYNMLQWRRQGSERWVVSDLNASELQGFAALLRGADSVAAPLQR